jgi:hypothetical protein
VAKYSKSHLSDSALDSRVRAIHASERGVTAEALAYLAEFDHRRLYLAAGYPTMYDFCVHELKLSEDSACKRIRAARAARDFPGIFDAVAEGRLHLSAIVLLAPRLTAENAVELLEAASGKTRPQLEHVLAERFPRPDVATKLEALPVPPCTLVATESTVLSAPGRMEAAGPPPRVKPLAPQRFSLQCTLDEETHDLLRRAQALLAHQVPAGDISEVLKRSLRLLVARLEQRKFATTQSPRKAGGRASSDTRYIPAETKRAVSQRDGGQCTYVSEAGHRCEARSRLQYDHIEPVARGGETSVANLRLRCRAHNQYAADQVFGADFMKHKREAAAEGRATGKRATEPPTPSATERSSVTPVPPDHDVVPCLRELGFRMDEARRAAAYCATIPSATVEQKVRAALAFLRPKTRFSGGQHVAAT